jgi:branched-chain amino acid transport system substrate-binding protein
MEHRSTRWRAVLAATIASTLVVAACGEGGDDDTSSGGAADAEEALGPEAPASGEPVKVGLISDGASEASDMSIELDVAEATEAYLNERRSGIGGRPIDLVTCVSETDPAMATDCANQMVEEQVAAVVIGSSAVVESIWNPLHDAGVPMMFFAANDPALLQDSESTFVLTNATAPLIDVPISVAEDQGEDKVTVVVIDVPAALSVYDEVAPAAYEDAGIDLEVVPVPPGLPDMSSQMQEVVGDDPGVIQVLGNDTFCIGAFLGLQTAGFDGTVTAVSQCVTDATRESVPADVLEGMVVSATAPVGADDESTRLYDAVAQTYAGGEIDTSRITGMNMFITLTGFAAALEGIEGDVTPESVTAAIKAMPETELPGSGGLSFRCGGEAVEGAPSVCTRGSLVTTLDDEGQPSSYDTVGEESS